MPARSNLCLLAAVLLLSGCHSTPTSSGGPAPAQSPHEIAQAANQAFLNRRTFDPWVLYDDPNNPSVIPFYLSDGKTGSLVTLGGVTQTMTAGQYRNGALVAQTFRVVPAPPVKDGEDVAVSRLDLRTGQFGPPRLAATRDWAHLWQTSDIVIDGDPEAQQVTHANLFYLLSSTFPGSAFSIPPMGLSSPVYQGHIFWDADVWMLPALIVQHPEYARPIVAYRYKMLAQARRNARAHGYAGAEYPWESAATGKEEAPADFAQERHITADVAWAVWQYYLWTGDAGYLKTQGWPILQATAQYWVSRVTKGADGKYHINGVLSPDETAGVVNDDAYTNAVVGANLRAATHAARLVGQTPDPRWATIADALFLPYDKARMIPAENDTPLTDRFSAKQADTLLLLHPLGLTYDAATQARMLDFYTAHTIPTGPAMTSSIEAVVAARLGLARLSLDDFHDSYRPFERAPWDAFSEKRTTDNVYFLTGMAGCVQSVLYGFAGLRVYEAGQKPQGMRLAGDAVASLYADPHLPPGWKGLTLEGVRFRGRTLTVRISEGNKVTVT